MKKNVLISALILSLMFVFAGCNKQAEPAVDNSMSDSSTTTTMAVPAPGVDPSTVEEMVVNNDGEKGETKVFNLEGADFRFSVEEMRVNEGDTVIVNLTTTDNMMHDWMVDEFNAATKKVSKGEMTTVEFIADKAGTFEYYCSVGNHRANGMVGKLIVE